MANYILKKEDVILRLNNCYMDYFYLNLLEAAKEEGSEYDKKLMGFILHLDQDVYGRGCVYVDIMDLEESNRRKLKYLTEKIIEKFKTKIVGQDRDLFLVLLEDFKNKIV